MRIWTVAAVCLLAPAGFAADPWSRYGGPTGDFRTPALPRPADGPEWKRAIGPGTSGVVADGERLYTTYSRPKEDRKSADEVTVALDAKTGKAVWEEATAVTMRGKQETFGGAPLQPQATPVVADGRVFTVGFTGLLQARDAATGKLLWATDLVADHAATPVQYGFAASPVVYADKLLVAVGGKSAAMAFDPKTGKPVWASEAGEPGYATPVPLAWGGRAFVVLLTRDTLFGLDPATGETRWKYPLPKKGLTNVPTPLAFADGRVLVSGQGWDGTRLLQLSGDAAVTVTEVWHQRKIQFFYTNWATDGAVVYGFPGNGGKRFTALTLKDGAVVSQDLGQTDANVVCAGNELLTLRGDGVVSVGPPTADGFEVKARGRPLTGRCWAAPTLLGDTLVVRSGTELARVRLSSFTADFKPPADSGVSALDAAYGPKPLKK